jgi:hypothetical protein
MPRTSPVWKLVAIVALLGLESGIGYAQNAAGPAMTAERSWQIQNILQSIDADRESWVNLLVSKWASVLNPTVYDVSSELGTVARVAPAWQVYGAALANDFMTASQILRGTRNAGPYIAGLSTSGAQFELTPQVIGNCCQELVYTPVNPPCRVVDTRLPGARTGIIPANSSRDFDLSAEAETEGQGGGPFPCPGLPSAHHIGWAINITVVNGFTAHGGLKAWPFTGPEPNVSVINWMPGQNGAIANGLTLTGCPGCADSITIKTFGDSAQVIIDVMGFYSAGTFNSSTITRVAGTPVGIPAAGRSFVNGAACPAGTSLVGGDVEHGNTLDVAIGESHQLGSTQWSFWMINNSGSTASVTGYSRCMDTPVKFN